MREAYIHSSSSRLHFDSFLNEGRRWGTATNTSPCSLALPLLRSALLLLPKPLSSGSIMSQLGYASFWILFAIVTQLLLVLLYVYFAIPTWRVRRVPCPSPKHPILGHIRLLEKYQSEVFVRFAHDCGPIYRFHVGRQPLVIVADAELSRQLAVKSFKSVPNRSIPIFIESSSLLARGLIFTKDSRWSSMRNILLPLYHSEQMSKYLPLMERVLGHLVAILAAKAEEKDEVKMSDFLLQLGIDVIGEAAFGTKFGLLDDEKAATSSPDSELVNLTQKSVVSLGMDTGAALSTICGTFLPFLYTPVREVMSMVPGTADWKVAKSNAKLMEMLDDLVERRDRELQTRGLKENESRMDALSLLLSARERSESAKKLLTHEYVCGLTYELLLAGSDTVATALSFTLYLIAGHPWVEKKLLEEIDGFGPPNRKPTMDELQAEFPYVEQVIKESLRFYPPAPVIAREVSEDIKLGGYDLPKGTWVWMAPVAVMRDPEHFADPEEFKPERFDLANEENKKRHPCAFMPFGLGPRTCIGNKFAMLEAKLTLIQLYQKFTFEHSLAMERPLALQFGLTSRPKFGVRLRVHPRSPPA